MNSNQSITLKLSKELLQQAQDIVGSTDINEFLITAIKSEIQRRQHPTEKINFWQEVEQLRSQMQQEGIEIDTQEIWENVRDKEVGREITL